jgi:pheromone shutdown protein TraB
MNKNLVDQPAHMATAIVAILPFAIAPSIATGAFAGFVIGMVREITEEGAVSLAAVRAVFASRGSRLDLLFWTLGGALAGIIARAV